MNPVLFQMPQGVFKTAQRGTPHGFYQNNLKWFTEILNKQLSTKAD